MGLEGTFGEDDFQSDEDFHTTRWWDLERQIDAVEIGHMIEDCYKEIAKNSSRKQRNSILYEDIMALEKYYHTYTGNHYRRPDGN